ncbi:MAG TPA: class I SAM-dependent methyltransferase [Chthoniobacterales bacterium]|jgi:SAM-dependent methyltransferase|nr:class I SAM-dependent methyltransferase [Chthoniobacterales bacterium]
MISTSIPKTTPTHAHEGGRLRALIITTPWLGPAARTIASAPIVRELRRRFGFRDSKSYWERRYQKGRTSGVGSYGRLAEFKAEVLNAFVERNNTRSVIEFGCGDGTQLTFARYPKYVGVDVAQGSIELCRARFSNDATKNFYLVGQVPESLGRFELVLSLDVIYHLVEDEVFNRYMQSLFDRAGRYVIIYSSNKLEDSGVPHVRHRRFTDWIEQHAPQWKQSGFVSNKYPHDPKSPEDTSFADFYFFELEA